MLKILSRWSLLKLYYWVGMVVAVILGVPTFIPAPASKSSRRARKRLKTVSAKIISQNARMRAR